MGCAVLVVRAARPADRRARLQLIRDALAETYTDAFLYFFFQELTLQAVVLCGAVLFIFCGVSVWGCLLLLPAAAAVVWLGVRMHAVAVANNAEVTLNSEVCGWVAEVQEGGGAGAGAGAGGPVRVVHERDLDRSAGGRDRDRGHWYSQVVVVGTVSACGARGEAAGWWVAAGAGAVRAGWRRRGAGGALLDALSAAAVRAGRTSLHTVTSHLQPAARALLHQRGWECRGTYHRQVLGEAVTLPMAQLALQLPRA